MKRKSRTQKREQWQARQGRVARRIARSRRTRLTVYRTANHIYAQLVDADTGRTITSVSTRSKGVLGDDSPKGKIEAARRVGKAVAERAREKQVERVVFNRNGFLFHGRVKALAEAAREAGLQF